MGLVRFALYAAPWVFISSPVNAVNTDISTGNDLWYRCTSSNFFDQGLCDGFIEGVMKGVETGEDGLRGRMKIPVPTHFSLICRPDGVTVGQIVDIIKKFLADSPQIRHLQAQTLIYGALTKAFPC